MSDDLLRAAPEYFAVDQAGFWRWAEDGDVDVVEWLDGTTIAYLVELKYVLNALTPAGLPPIGAVLLLLAACRNDWRASTAGLGILTGMLQEDPNGHARLVETSRLLDTVRGLTPTDRSSFAAKAGLAALVFENCPQRLDPELSRRIVGLLGEGELRERLCALPPSTPVYPLARDLELLKQCLTGLSTPALQNRVETGVDAVPAPAPITVPKPTPHLLDELAGDAETSGLAQLTRQLMAALQLPRRTGRPSAHPTGGYADIGNRGELDKLLISELALDDLTLAVRLANNEALYIRREEPPAKPTEARIILLDNTIRMWGAPRLLALATALAFTAGAEGERIRQVLQHQLNGFAPADLKSRTGVLAALATLTALPDSGSALVDYDRQSAAEAPACERILITHEQRLSDPGFLQAEQQLATPLHLIATVHRNGRFRLYETGPAGRNLVVEALLDLEEILSGVKRVRPWQLPPEKQRLALQLLSVLRQHRDRLRSPLDRLPGILTLHPLPLRLPVRARKRNTNSCYRLGDGVLTISHTGSLMLKPEALGSRRGAFVVSDRLPPATAFSQRCCFTAGYVFYVATEHKNGIEVTQYTAQSPEPVRQFAVPSTNRPLLHLSIQGEYLILGSQNRVRAVHLGTLQMAGESVGLLADLHFQYGEVWVGNRQLRFNGTVYNQIGAPMPDSFIRSWNHMCSAVAMPDVPLIAPLQAIGMTPAKNALVLKTYKNTFKQFRLTTSAGRWENLPHALPKVLQPIRWYAFQPVPKWQRTGCTLRAASFARGGTAFEDNRGMLHLISDLPELPEITLTLTLDRPAGIWSSSGHCCGDAYFLSDARKAEPEIILRELVQVLERFL